jgi:tRNA (cytidine/uridine-2'-O-)-methyltransferase
VIEHPSWDSFVHSSHRPKNIFLLSTHAKKSIWDASFQAGDGLLFGNEGGGVPADIHQWAGDQRLTIPKYSPDLRSLNLAASVGISVYEAIRQISQAS